MRLFILIWLGQILSIIGSALTAFALDVWVYQTTESIFQFTLLTFFNVLPFVVVSPFAGTLVDRWNRRWTMIISDSCAGIFTLMIALLFISNHLQIWHIYLINLVSSCFSAFQWPAYIATTTLLVSEDDLSRVSSLTQLGKAITKLLAPALGAVLLEMIHLPGVIILDFVTLFFALIPLFLIKLPEVNSEAKEISLNSLLEDMIEGWNYLTKQQELLGLMIFFSITCCLFGVVSILSIPFLLSFSSTIGLGIILSTSACGMLMGSFVMFFWGKFWSSINTFFIAISTCGVFMSLAGLRFSVFLFTISYFCMSCAWMIVRASVQVIFQKKVPPNIQARVFSFNATLAGTSMLLAYSIAAPLDTQIFEPLMEADGFLSENIGSIIGIGPGRGIGLLYIFMGILLVLMTIIAYQFTKLRLIENEITDAIIDIPK